jgi:hypothetical protein
LKRKGGDTRARPGSKVARKLDFDIQPTTPVAVEEHEEFDCYCGDKAKECTSKKGAIFYCCPHSRYESEKSKYVSDCDFFLMKDQLIDTKCVCGIKMRRFETKDKCFKVDICVYKNAPTIYKKLKNYKCDDIFKLAK